MMDPFLSLLPAADATTTLRVGTGVALPLEHDLFALAKAVATLDRLSGGRFDFGVGVGWNVEQLADHRPDIPWASRYRALAECVAALKALWRDDEAEHHGRWFDFDAGVVGARSRCRRPTRRSSVGMAGRLGTAHAVAWADAWMPMDLALGNVAKRVDRFRAGGGRGRPAADAHHPDARGATRRREQLARATRELGIEQVVLGAGPRGLGRPARTALPFLDRYAELVPELSG